MKTKNILFLTLFAFASIVSKAQIPNYIISLPNQCYSSGGNTTQAVVTTTVPGAASYSWSVMSGTNCTAAFTGGSSNGTVANFFFPCCGVFTINCTAYTGLGVPIPGAMPQQSVNIQCPTFTPNFSYFQTPSGANFVNLSVNSNTAIPLNYHWDFGDGGASTLYSPSHTYSSTGIYTVTLHDSLGIAPFCGASITQTVSICNISFNSPTSIVAGANVTFSGSTSPTSATSYYNWQTNGAIPSTTQGTNAINATVNYSTIGAVPVVFSYSSSVPFCTLGVTQTLQVNSPTCNLTPSVTIAQGVNGQMIFTNASTGTNTGTSYTIHYGNGTSGNMGSNFTNVTTNYSVNTVYNATLIAKNNVGCLNVYQFPVSVNNYSPCNASFSHTVGVNGNVSFYSNYGASFPSSHQFIWNFGNGLTYTANGAPGISANTQYTANGTYVATLTIITGTQCTGSSQATITINNILPCNLNAAFTHTIGANGIVNFANTSTGTVAPTSFTWNSGNGNFSFVNSPTFTYNTPGTYTASLIVNNNMIPWCVDTASVVIVISPTTSPCSLNANFTVTTGTNGLKNFINTSTGTSSNASYAWIFGDGNSSNLQSPSHTYSSNGTYTVSLIINNNSNPFCVDSIKVPIFVSNVNSPCNLNASFTHTMGTGGQVNFFNTSTGTNSTTTYNWNFGNGFTSTAMHPWQAYANGGTHLVSLFVSNGNGCSDSTIVAINVTGLPCIANSNYTLVPTGTPKFWYAIPNYPWNITKAHWSWGDGSSDTLLYTSHLYSVSATYSICLTVTVSCGATSSTCVNNFIYKGAGEQMDILGVNVVQPSSQITGINEARFKQMNDLKIIPNPNNGVFELQSLDFEGIPTLLSIYNLLGEKVFETQQNQMNANTNLNLDHLNKGLYFIHLNSNNKNATIKILIEK